MSGYDLLILWHGKACRRLLVECRLAWGGVSRFRGSWMMAGTPGSERGIVWLYYRWSVDGKRSGKRHGLAWAMFR